MGLSRRVVVVVVGVLGSVFGAAALELGACAPFGTSEEANADTGSPDGSPVDGGAETTTSDGGVLSRFDGALPEASVVHNGHLYAVVISPKRLTWPEARTAAVQAGGHLVTIANMEEDDVVRSLLSSDMFVDGGGGPWIGLFQPNPTAADEPDGGWAWVDGTPFSFAAWRSTEPNNAGGSENVTDFGGVPPDIGWNDDHATVTDVRAFVVEIDP